MAVETAADRAAMLNVDEHGIEATYIDEFGVETNFYGIFDNPYFAPSGLGEVSFAESNPSILASSSDCTTMKYGERIEINSVVWVIRELMPDGVGMTEITLERQ